MDQNLEELHRQYLGLVKVSRELLKVVEFLAQDPGDETGMGEKYNRKFDNLFVTRERRLAAATRIMTKLPPPQDLAAAMEPSSKAARLLESVKEAAEEALSLGRELEEAVAGLRGEVRRRIEDFTTGQKLMRGYAGSPANSPKYIKTSA